MFTNNNPSCYIVPGLIDGCPHCNGSQIYGRYRESLDGVYLLHYSACASCGSELWTAGQWELLIGDLKKRVTEMNVLAQEIDKEANSLLFRIGEAIVRLEARKQKEFYRLIVRQAIALMGLLALGSVLVKLVSLQ